MTTQPLSGAVRGIRRLAGAADRDEPSDEQLLRAFQRDRDERAFAEIVRRHGRLVLGVCLRTLGHEQDAEDACQATFLVLARSATSIRQERSLASWLYGVALRAARKARQSRDRHRPPAPLPDVCAPAADELSWREALAVLDEEVQQLPEVLRAVFVECGLNGRTKPEAARGLGLKEGTVSSRLDKARRLLRDRLARRGIALPAALALLGLTPPRLSAGLTLATARAALAYAGGTAHGVVPVSVVNLAEGVTHAMLLSKTRIVTALVVLLGLLAGSAALFPSLAARPTPGDEKTDRPAKEKPAPAEVAVRVVDPDGKPVQGAKLYRVVSSSPEQGPGLRPALLGESDPAGRLRMRPEPGDGPRPARFVPQLMAVAPGYGPALLPASRAAAGKEVVFRLVKDDVPIAGRIVNLEGKPLAGVTIRPFGLYATGKGDLGPWVEAVRARKRVRMDEYFPSQIVSQAGLVVLPASVKTDADGRFRLTGVGRERIVGLEMSGPNVESDFLIVMTRTGKSFRMPDSPDSSVEFTVYPATFQHIASPPQPVVGTVRDARTGKPIPGARIDLGASQRATTKADGTYRLDSAPGFLFRHAGPVMIPVIAIPPADRPYLPAVKTVRRGSRTEPLRVDFRLALGVWAEGRVTDKATGKGMAATVEYFADTKNPHLKDTPDFAGLQRHAALDLFRTRADGSFRIPVLPGRGAVAARGASGLYLAAEPLPADGVQLQVLPGYLGNMHALTLLDARPDTPVKCDLSLDPGRTLTGTVLDAEGKPLAGARAMGLGPAPFWDTRALAVAGFTMVAVHPKQSRWLLLVHPNRQLGAAVEVTGEAKESLEIRLQPTGTITGRLLDSAGRPWKGQPMRTLFDRRGWKSLRQHWQEVVQTDDEGRFRIEGVLPGMRYQVNLAGKPPALTIGSIATGLELKAGEVRALGDVKARMFRD